jgi:Na+/H+-translocating membrane pyrophosphatase
MTLISRRGDGVLAGFGMGASTVAIFARVAGGITILSSATAAQSL